VGTVTTFLAVWGAVVSTIAIIWNIRRDLADRGKLRVICYIGQTMGGSAAEDAKRRLVYYVTNTGRRPILVTHIGGAFTKESHFIVPTRVQMPRMLQPGEYLLEYSRDLSTLERKPQALWAIDSVGKYWKIPRRQLRRLIRESQKETLRCTG
jgi:hypothetical protein